MFKLNGIYRPVTAQPFLSDKTYIELQPCKALSPYVCCFWGTPEHSPETASAGERDILVIPDTCMDIIFYVNMDKSEVNALFAGISDNTFQDRTQAGTASISCFAIRFYCWAVPLFSHEPMKHAFNSFVDTDVYFKNFKRDLQDILMDNTLITDRAAKVEQYLIKKLDSNKQNNNVMNAVYKILEAKGTPTSAEISGYAAVGQRQLERLFLEYVGVSPQKLSKLVRFQYLWHDILFDGNFNMHDSVCKYTYSDQSHLLNDFKRYHTLSPGDARTFAYKTR
ncbi:helix-turn-helix domain-containing protein [Ruminiclostridium cellobioparum]|jgi:AraC-like DNA-binding protein|uniref:helix-turn-helix domain-containing protein n=1 Tax=Ruminiclostridium cellobioparum TaxID=29355 RepID=UPI0028A582AE|nr:helix-turn-helix domain-containing protein [Ruminiclostridium cellobioparum]